MARFGESRFGVDAYGPSSYAGVAGGLISVDVTYKLADRDNHHRKDVSAWFASGEVAVDLNQPSPMSFRGEVLEAGLLTPYRDWIAPILTITRPDPDGHDDVIEEGQVGLYCVMPAQRSYTAAGGTETVTGVDALWLMQQARVAEPYAVASGQNVATAIRTLCSSLSLRSSIQASTVTLPKRRTWKAGTSKLDIANDLARSIGFLPLYTDRIGRVRTRRFQRLGKVQPARTISSAAGDVVETVTLDADWSRLCNEVLVIGNDPKGDPVEAYRINDDPASPTSTVRIGTPDEPVVIAHHPFPVELTDNPTQDEVDQLADRIMDQGSSVFLRTTVTSLPTTDWDLHDVIRLDIETDDGTTVATGVHRWDSLRLPLGVDSVCTWRCGKLVPWAKVSE